MTSKNGNNVSKSGHKFDLPAVKLNYDNDTMEMDFYNSRYFIINKYLLMFMGLWPYQSILVKTTIRVIFISLVIVFFIPQFICVYTTRHDFDKFIQAVATLFYLSATTMKYFCYIATEKRIKILYKNILENWKMLENKAEKNVLLTFSDTGRLLTIGYVSYMISALIVFITVPALPSILDKFSPLANGTRPKIFILEGDFLVDRYQYYTSIYLFEALSCTLTVFIFCTIDSTYAVTVEQCVGLFAVVKLRLQSTTNYKEMEAISLDHQMKDRAYDALTNTTKLHKKVLHFAQVLESSYSTAFLIVMIFNVGILSVGSVVILINLNNSMELMRYTLIFVGLTIHMFYVSWPGQKLIDASGSIFYDAYNNEWYNCSLKCQKLLKFMMLRSLEPMCLTCGGFYVMNMQNYGSLMKTSVSYITVFASFR